jgi:hypothetical protein
MNIMINSNKYVLFYLEESLNNNSNNRYYRFCKYKENDKLTIQSINKEVNRQIKNYKNGDKVNSNYTELVELFNNKTFNINIYGGSNLERIENEYNRLLRLPKYTLRNKPKLKKEIYDNSWSDKAIEKDYKLRLKMWNNTNNQKLENRKELKNRLTDKYSNQKFIEGNINDIKIYFNNFIEKNKTLNKTKENIKNNPNEKIKCSCGMYYTRTNRSHHIKKHHNKKCLIIDI